MDPKTFEEAVASLTRLKTLEKTRAMGKITGAAAEVKEESKESDQVSKLVDRFGIVLPPQHKIQVPLGRDITSGVRINQGSSIRTKTQSRQNTGAPAATAGGEGKSQELSTKETGETPKNKEGYSYKGNNYRRGEYDRRKYCMAHQKAGHSTEL